MKNVSNFLFILFLTVPFGIGQSASDIFIESCRNSGENSSVIRSGYTEFDCTTNRQLPSGMVQKIVDKIIASTKADADSGTISQDVLEKQLEGIQRFSRRQTGKDDAKYRYKLLFAGNDVFFAPNASVCKRYMAIEQHDGDQWQLGEFAIMNGSPNTGGGYAGFVPRAKIATIEAKVRPGYEFQRFGRMQQSETYHELLMSMKQEDRKAFQITEKATQAFQEKMKEKNYSFEMAGTTSYDGSKTATIVEVKSDGQVRERFWIDPARGYICPLIQCFDASGTIEFECKSSRYFLHKKTGLWYPEIYEQTRTIPFPMKHIYTLYRESFQLNQPVSDKMFTIDIPEGTQVVDQRNTTEKIKYFSMAQGKLSLAEGGLDLEKMKWLMREGDITYGSETPSAAVRWFHYITLPVGIFFIVLALYLKYRQWKGQTK